MNRPHTLTGCASLHICRKECQQPHVEDTSYTHRNEEPAYGEYTKRGTVSRPMPPTPIALFTAVLRRAMSCFSAESRTARLRS